ncbi:DUF4972 domain-containing protein [Bacteroides thetaiotaomicron]|nr:DUF4972 domain-containing protein [Bacteroides thetaiotaomicron]
MPEETARLLKESDEKIAEFKATVRTEDLLVPAEPGSKRKEWRIY